MSPVLWLSGAAGSVLQMVTLVRCYALQVFSQAFLAWQGWADSAALPHGTQAQGGPPAALHPCQGQPGSSLEIQTRQSCVPPNSRVGTPHWFWRRVAGRLARLLGCRGGASQFAKIPVGHKLSGGCQKATCKMRELDIQPRFFPPVGTCTGWGRGGRGGGARPAVTSLAHRTGSAVVSGRGCFCPRAVDPVGVRCVTSLVVVLGAAWSEAPRTATRPPSLSMSS